MIESIRQIGHTILSANPDALPIRKDLLNQSNKNKNKNILMKIIFNIKDNSLNTSIEEISEKKLEEYLWIGNPMANKPQVVLTTDNPQYLLGGEKKKKKFAFRALQEFIEENSLDKDNDVRELHGYLKLIKENFFSVGAKIKLDEKKLKKEAALFTPVLVKERAIEIVKHPGYRKVISYYLFEYSKLKGYGRCHICGREGEVFYDPSFPEGKLLKIYVTDKTGFLSGISDKPESLSRTFAICPKCRKELIIGLNYIESKLSLRLGDSFVYAIPNIYGGISKELLDALSKAVKIVISSPIRSLKEMEDFLRDYAEELGERVYMLNLIFGRPSKSSFEFVGFIQNVPTTRLLEVISQGLKTTNKVQKSLNLSIEVNFSLSGVYRIFPLRRSEWRPFIDLVDALYHASPYPVEDLYNRGVRLARIHQFSDNSFNISPGGDFSLSRDIVQFNVFMALLRKVGVIMSGNPGSPSGTEYDEYFSVSGYDEKQKALFLAGVLIARIGRAQFAKGSKNKPILEKINFSGMSKERVMILANQIMDGLKNYRLLNSKNEELYGQMKALLDRNLDQLRDPIENVFYILSGYGFESVRRRGEKNERE